MFILLISCKLQFNVFILVHLIQLVHHFFLKVRRSVFKRVRGTDYFIEIGMDEVAGAGAGSGAEGGR